MYSFKLFFRILKIQIRLLQLDYYRYKLQQCVVVRVTRLAQITGLPGVLCTERLALASLTVFTGITLSKES
jgi:hypothetical protein